MSETLSLWTIYDHPTDYPNNFVARRFDLDRPTPEHIVANSLDELRQMMMNAGLSCLTRNPEDEPHIVETWL